MIDYLHDSSFGRIENYPHTMRGGLGVSYTSGNSKELSGCGCGNIGEEVLKCDSKYIYIRDRINSYYTNVFDEEGYKVKTIPTDEVDY